MNKPTLTKAQAEALDELLALYKGDREAIIRNIIYARQTPELTEMPFITLAAALVNGYEVEQTPEDRVREYYRVAGRKAKTFELQRSPAIAAKFRSEQRGIKKTLDLLGIKISGVIAE